MTDKNDEEAREFKFLRQFRKFVRIILCIIILLCLSIIIYSPERKIRDNILKGDYDKAIEICNIGAKVYPNNPTWYSLRGYARFNIQNYQGALDDFDKAYSLEDDIYKMMNFDNKIYVRYFLKDYKTAIKDFDNEIEKSKTSDEKDAFLWDKAQFLYNIGENEKALNIYNFLLSKSEDDNIYLVKNRLYYERAEVYLKLGNTELAKKDIEESEKLELEETFETPIPPPTLLLDEE